MEAQGIEPELQRAVPRPVRRRGTRGYGTLFSQFLLVPILLLCALMPLWCVHLIVLRTFGPVVTCQIVDKYREYDRDDHEWRHYLRYRVTLGGKSSLHRELVDADSYLRTPIGSTARLQVSPLFPGFDSVLLLPGRSVWGDVWVMGVSSILMLGLTALMIWYIYILPARRRKLVIWGTPVIGRLYSKTKYQSSKSSSYYFHYEYWPVSSVVNSNSALGSTLDMTPSSGSTSPRLVDRQSVRASDWPRAQEGETYTILYDPKRPQSSVIYLYGDYEVVGMLP